VYRTGHSGRLNGGDDIHSKHTVTKTCRKYRNPRQLKIFFLVFSATHGCHPQYDSSVVSISVRISTQHVINRIQPQLALVVKVEFELVDGNIIVSDPETVLLNKDQRGNIMMGSIRITRWVLPWSVTVKGGKVTDPMTTGTRTQHRFSFSCYYHILSPVRSNLLCTHDAKYEAATPQAGGGRSHQA
jgi:hypothetical protein